MIVHAMMFSSANWHYFDFLISKINFRKNTKLK